MSRRTARAMVVMPAVGEGRGAGAEQGRGEVADDAVDGPGFEEGARQGGTAFEEHGAHPPGVQGREEFGDGDAAVAQGQPEQVDAGQVPGVGVLGDDEQGRGRVVEDAGSGQEGGVRVEGDAQRLGGPFDAAYGQVRVVGTQGSAAHEDGVGLGAQPVDVGAGFGGGDPAAAAVGGGAAAVEGGGVLPGDVGAAQAYGGQPRDVRRPRPRPPGSRPRSGHAAARRVAAPPLACGSGSGTA